MVCTSVHSYPRIKWCFVFGLSSVSSIFVAMCIGNHMHENQAANTIIVYVIIVHLLDPNLHEYVDQQGNEEHCHWTTLDT